MAEEQQQDVETLKRRGRRRLVGAVALVLAAVIVLPMVFDPEPRGTAPVSVRIPGEDETPFAPKPPPKKVEPAKKAEPPKKADTPPPAEEFVVQVGAFSNPQAAIAKLKAAKMPHYTEPMQGNLTRVRAGPFPTRQAADKALEQLKGLGFQPGAVSTKTG
ncbi:MAG TPA: SPOR domain-containing protein [Burkholderiales bacterium]|nr:SPOR domain-containing protein [Burkholderiales bacterium]